MPACAPLMALATDWRLPSSVSTFVAVVDQNQLQHLLARVADQRAAWLTVGRDAGLTPANYESGTWGPASGDEMMHRMDREWRRP